MKTKIMAIAAAAALSTSAIAFIGPFDNDKGYVEDNGIFAFNPWEMTDPRFYSTEFTNFINEFNTPDYITSYQHNPYAYYTPSAYNFPVDAK